MKVLALHEIHARRHAQFAEVGGAEVVAHYGDAAAEHAALRDAAGMLDLSFRGRLCLTGTDRQRLLNGQVTNSVKDLKAGEGCYAALLTAKGRMESDLNIHCLPDEFLLDFEPGFSESIAARFDRFIIADDVQVTDVASLYGLLSVQGPRAGEVVLRAGLISSVPAKPFHHVSPSHPVFGEVYCVQHARTGSLGFDCFIPATALESAAELLFKAVRDCGGRAVGWDALETARIEAGIPRFAQDMDETNLPPEAGLDDRAISYTKGCYIGQEIIARIRTYGQVTKMLRGLRLENGLKSLPRKSDKLYRGEREIGYVTSCVFSPTLKTNIALAYVRREHNQIGTELELRTADSACTARIVELPFRAA